ncbi:MAG TPA: iron-containing alcohol dehydrogenase [Burkholderiaceae bacterium]|nr:iron-containing alcohol dehydrogenase [Burkholderiaceae bacterium]HKW85043.1 iron-containing alcohol dehydrogenase [Burkholderiaceae bacterium]
MTITRFAFPTTIHFGPGARKLVGPRLAELGLKRPLIVTDKGLAGLPLIAELKADLEKAGLKPEVYGGVFGNPVASQVTGGASAYKKHKADCVVGVGGGAALDVAKVVGVLATHPGDVIEYAWDHPKVRTITEARPYFIALPTTSGTGSEVGRSSVISEEGSHIKRIIFSPLILARTVYADPELTLGLPAAVTAATGMDALTHNVESYLSPAYHPLCDGIALEGTRIAARSLLTAVREPDNLAARGDMMMASMMGAVAFQKDLGAVHSCAHALGTVCDLHHGLANALMIEPVMTFNYEAVPAKFDELARVVGAGGGNAFVPWLARLKQQIGLPAGLEAAGVRRAQFGKLVEIALADGCHATNPRPCTAADFQRFFEEAY